MFVFLTNSRNTTGAYCNVMHDEVGNVVFDDLPASWEIDSNPYDTATLECSHIFHISAITLHFAVNGMRCPVCRDGIDGILDTECIPAAVRPQFVSKQGKIQDAHDSQSEVMHTFHINFNRIERDWILMAEFLTTSYVPEMQSRRTLRFVPTPIRRDLAQAHETMVQFNTQGHFTRRLTNVSNRLTDNQNDSQHTMVSFALYHYCLPQVTFRTSYISLDDLTAALRGHASEGFVTLPLRDSSSGFDLGSVAVRHHRLNADVSSSRVELLLNADYMLQLVLSSFNFLSGPEQTITVFAYQDASPNAVEVPSS